MVGMEVKTIDNKDDVIVVGMEMRTTDEGWRYYGWHGSEDYRLKGIRMTLLWLS